MKENKTKPDIRFKGFTEAWEQRKFGELLNETRDKTTIEDEDILLSCAIDGMFLNSELFSHFRGSSNIGYLKIKKNNLILSAQNLHLGNCNVNLRFEHGIISPAYKVYELVECNPLFMQAWVKQDTTKEFFLRASTEGASVCRKNIVWEELYKQTLPVPKIDEQEKIGEYFASLDNLITLHQRECDQLKELKKSMLKKMFPRDGSSIPEVRFAGFTDAWEQRKLGDNIVEYTKKTTVNNQYPVLTSSRRGIFFQTDYYDGNQIASIDNTGYNIVPYGYFTYRHMSDDEIFHFNINDITENGIVSTLYPVFTTDKNLNSKYLQYQLNYGKEFAKYAILQKQGGSRTYMYLNKLKELYLTIPNSIEEQKKISTYFMEIDNLITLHQRELEILKNLKKTCLKRMFI